MHQQLQVHLNAGYFWQRKTVVLLLAQACCCPRPQATSYWARFCSDLEKSIVESIEAGFYTKVRMIISAVHACASGSLSPWRN